MVLNAFTDPELDVLHSDPGFQAFPAEWACRDEALYQRISHLCG
jgi:hypothetical protein